MTAQKKILQLLIHPNTLTLYRIIAIPAIVILMLFPNRTSTFFAALIFSAAAITDFLDGYLARLHWLESGLGRIIDPLADKLLVSSSFIMLASLGWVPAWMVCIIIGREIAVTGLRNIITENSGDISSSRLGKYKTGFQIAAIIPLLLHYPCLEIDFQAIGHIFLWTALIMTVWSGGDYFFKFRKLLNT